MEVAAHIAYETFAASVQFKVQRWTDVTDHLETGICCWTLEGKQHKMWVKESIKTRDLVFPKRVIKKKGKCFGYHFVKSKADLWMRIQKPGRYITWLLFWSCCDSSALCAAKTSGNFVKYYGLIGKRYSNLCASCWRYFVW